MNWFSASVIRFCAPQGHAQADVSRVTPADRERVGEERLAVVPIAQLLFREQNANAQNHAAAVANHLFKKTNRFVTASAEKAMARKIPTSGK